MADYKDAQDVVPHKFYKAPLVISNSDYKINVNGLDQVTATPGADVVAYEKVNDGLTQLTVNPDKSITFAFTTAAAADTEDDLWDLLISGEVFSFSYTDPNSEKFTVNGKNCLFVSSPVVTRNNEMPKHEWTIICAYGTIRGGAFTRSV